MQTFTAVEFNAYMQQRRAQYLEQCKADHEITANDHKMAALYYPQVYNNRGQLLRTGYVHYSERTGQYYTTKRKAA